MAVTGTECRRKVFFHFLKQMRVKSTAWGTEPTSPASLHGRERCLSPCFCTFKTWQRQYAKNRRHGQRCVCDISVLTGVCRGQECEWCRLIYVSVIYFFQVETMQRLKQKAEIQSLASIAPHFLTRVYLPNKLRYGGWIWASAALYWNMYDTCSMFSHEVHGWILYICYSVFLLNVRWAVMLDYRHRRLRVMSLNMPYIIWAVC